MHLAAVRARFLVSDPRRRAHVGTLADGELWMMHVVRRGLYLRQLFFISIDRSIELPLLCQTFKKQQQTACTVQNNPFRVHTATLVKRATYF